MKAGNSREEWRIHVRLTSQTTGGCKIKIKQSTVLKIKSHRQTIREKFYCAGFA